MFFVQIDFITHAWTPSVTMLANSGGEVPLLRGVWLFMLWNLRYHMQTLGASNRMNEHAKYE